MRYLDGEMTEAERIEFEEQVKIDQSLQIAMEKLQLAKAAIKQFGVKKKVGAIHEQMMKELKSGASVKKMGGLRRVIRYSVAIAASVLLVFAGVEGYKFYKLSPGSLYAENYSSYELITSRDSGETRETAIEKSYRERNYAEVIKLNGNSVLYINDIFLTGMSYLEMDDAARAISSFQVVLADINDDNKAMLKDITEYYLALAYLKNRDYDQAIELMSNIHDDPSHLYKSKFTHKYINRVKQLKWR